MSGLLSFFKRPVDDDRKAVRDQVPVAMEARIRQLAEEELNLDIALDDDIYTPPSLWQLETGLIDGHTDVDAHYIDADGPPLI